MGAGFLTGVDAASPLASVARGMDSVLVMEVGFGEVGGTSRGAEDEALLGLRGFGKGNSRFGGIHILEMSQWSIGVEDGLWVSIIREVSATRTSLSLSDEKNGEADNSLEVAFTRSESSSRCDCIWEM